MGDRQAQVRHRHRHVVGYRWETDRDIQVGDTQAQVGRRLTHTTDGSSVGVEGETHRRGQCVRGGRHTGGDSVCGGGR